MRKYLCSLTISVLPLIGSPAFGQSGVNLSSTGCNSTDCRIAEAAKSDVELPHRELDGIRVEVFSTGAVYLMMHGQLRWIPSTEIYNRLFVNWNGIFQILLLDGFDIGPPLGGDARLIETEIGTVYLLCDGKKHHVSNPATLARYHFDLRKAVEVPSFVAALIPNGPPL